MVSLAPGAASAGTQVVSPSANPQVGQSFSTTVSVNLTGVDELNGFDVRISYNSAVVNATSVSLAPFWNLPLDAGSISGGSVHAAASRLGAQPPAYCTGSCALFTVNWTAVGAGSAQLQASPVILAGRQDGAPGSLTQISVALGSVVVPGPASATATNTSVPPTNTAVPSSPSPVPATNTSAPATNTPAAPTNTPVPPLATQTAVAVAPTAQATPTIVVSAPVQPTVPGPPAPQPALPTTAAPAPSTSGGEVETPTRAPAFLPNGQLIPLPPRTGDGESLASSPWSPVRVGGLALMGIAGLIGALEVLQLRARRRGIGEAIDQFFREEETRGLRGG
jgi:hypothetical protein